MTDAEPVPALSSASSTPDGDATPLGSIKQVLGGELFHNTLDGLDEVELERAANTPARKLH